MAAPVGRGRGQGLVRVSPARVHSGESERHPLEEEDHEEPLAGWAVPYALSVFAGLGRQSGQVGLGEDPGILLSG